jgi:hypothetical protein
MIAALGVSRGIAMAQPVGLSVRELEMIRIVRLALLALVAFGAPSAVAAQEQEIVVSGEVARAEIERILREDDLETERMSPREVAETMAAIQRGRAPQDFWAAYQTHLQAWQRFAAATEQASRQEGVQTFGLDTDTAEAERAVNSTFEEVRRIAQRYGARLPGPRVNPREIA